MHSARQTCVVMFWPFDLQLAHKYDPQKEEELRMWIEEVTGRKLPENFMEGLKDGVILCEWAIPSSIKPLWSS